MVTLLHGEAMIIDFVHHRALQDRRPTCVVVPDATRPQIYLHALRDLLVALADQGSPTTVLVALGLHRPMTEDELEPLRKTIQGLEISLIQHDATGDLIDRSFVDGRPVALHRAVVEAERVICVGTVEPHQYAGYSGGIKAVAIGCAGAQTISAMHGLELLRDPRTTLGRAAGNPFQETLWRIADLPNVLGLQFVPGTNKIFFGELREAFKKACKVARETFFIELNAPLDWLHLPVPTVKAANFYQASRAATYAALVDDAALRRGGLIVVEAACPEGLGTGRGERACAQAMRRGASTLLDELDSDETVQISGGQQRAYVLARATHYCTIALVGAPPIDVLEPMGIAQYDSVDEALADSHVDGQRGLRLDNIFQSIPRLSRPTD